MRAPRFPIKVFYDGSCIVCAAEVVGLGPLVFCKQSHVLAKQTGIAYGIYSLLAR